MTPELEKKFLSFLDQNRGINNIGIDAAGDYFSRVVAYWNEVVESNPFNNRRSEPNPDMLAFMNVYFHTRDAGEKRLALSELRKMMLIIGGRP